MKLGTLLASIADTEGNIREQLKMEFLERAKNHKEEKILMECYKSACAGCKYINLAKNTVPPEELESEGFTLGNAIIGVNYYFC